MLLSISLDSRHASVTTRERFHLSEASVAELYGLPRSPLLQEVALLSTCNRLELYAWTTAQDEEACEAATQELIGLWVGNDAERTRELGGLVSRRAGLEAASHLMRVAAGLESQVLGDAQILGQVRRAYRQSRRAGGVGPGLHRLFGRALHAAKRVQRETALVGGRQSVGAEAAVLAARRVGPLAKRRAVVIGCGKTGERAARQLVKLGAADIVLVNRSPEKAEALAREVWGRAAPFDRLHRELARADVAIVATSAEQPPIRAASLRFCRESAGAEGQPLLFIDLSIPRSVEPEVAGLAGVTLLDLDALQLPLAQAAALRQAAVPKAEAIVAEELEGYGMWVKAAAARAALLPLRLALGEVCRRELAYARAQEGGDLERVGERIIAKLMARPMMALRMATERGDPVDGVSETLRTLFGAPVPTETG